MKSWSKSTLERSLGAHPIDLELWNEDGHLARGAGDDPTGRSVARKTRLVKDLM